MKKKGFCCLLLSVVSVLLAFCLSLNPLAAHIILPGSDLDKMEYFVWTYSNAWSDRQIKNECGLIHVDTSYREEDFWSTMNTFAIFDRTFPYPEKTYRYSLEDIQSIAYSLFPDYDGSLPAFPEFMRLCNPTPAEDDTVLFTPVLLEMQKLFLLGAYSDADGEVTAVYLKEWSEGTDSYELFSFSFTPNSRYNPDCLYSYPYVVSGITCIGL